MLSQGLESNTAPPQAVPLTRLDNALRLVTLHVFERLATIGAKFDNLSDGRRGHTAELAMPPLRSLPAAADQHACGLSDTFHVCRARAQTCMHSCSKASHAGFGAQRVSLVAGDGREEPCKPPCRSRSTMNLGNRCHSLLSWVGRARIDSMLRLRAVAAQCSSSIGPSSRTVRFALS